MGSIKSIKTLASAKSIDSERMGIRNESIDNINTEKSLQYGTTPQKRESNPNTIKKKDSTVQRNVTFQDTQIEQMKSNLVGTSNRLYGGNQYDQDNYMVMDLGNDQQYV